VLAFGLFPPLDILELLTKSPKAPENGIMEEKIAGSDGQC